MTSYTVPEAMMRAFAGYSVPNELSGAIDKAIEMSSGGQFNFTVVRTKDGETRIYSDFQMQVGSADVVESVYSTDCGYLYEQKAA